MKKYLVPLFFVLLGCGEHSLEEFFGGLFDSSSSNDSDDVSSSSGGGGSNSGGGGVGTLTDTRDGKTYRTVPIGTQVWMAENLNYATGGKCGIVNTNLGESTLTDANTTTCDTYGRLYTWVTAMALPSSCNSNSCAGQISAKHRGICPSGWYLPSDADWNVLMKFVNPSCSDNRDCDGAGTKLKATSGWKNYYAYLGNNSNGTDNYGFSALPGGWGALGDFFDYVGSDGNWWSSSEYSTTRASFRNMYYDEGVYRGDTYKDTILYSVRCFQDNGSSSSSGGNTQDSCPNASTGSGTLSCGGQTYKTKQIGSQVWMAENLNYNASGSKCYDNDPANCQKYGRLYNWVTAMALPSGCNSSYCAGQISAKHRGICPSGWHIPSDADWHVLMKFANPSCITMSDNIFDCDGAGAKLKATSGWDYNYIDGKSGSGTDNYGFAALPGSGGDPSGIFYGVGSGGIWWSSLERSADYAYNWGMYYRTDALTRSYGTKNYLESVRCVKD